MTKEEITKYRKLLNDKNYVNNAVESIADKISGILTEGREDGCGYRTGDIPEEIIQKEDEL